MKIMINRKNKKAVNINKMDKKKEKVNPQNITMKKKKMTKNKKKR